jgi:hypothetical protein
MARQRRNNRISGQFAAQLVEMLESPAYRVLSLSAHRVLDRIQVELAHHGGADNGALPVTYDQFVEYGLHRHAIAPAVRELVALGFIEMTERGRHGNGEFRTPNKFRLTFRPTGKAAETNEWRKFETIEGAELMAQAARKTPAEHSQRPSHLKRRLRVVP